VIRKKVFTFAPRKLRDWEAESSETYCKKNFKKNQIFIWWL